MHDEVAEQYEAFAVETAEGSPCFRDWASAVAQDPRVLAWIGGLPPAKRQPNLVFAAARWHGVPAPGPYEGLRSALLERGPEVRETILARSTQTNEPRRLATLIPVLARIEQESGRPLALVEVGASAGLCLHPDRYAVEWEGAGRLPLAGAPVLRCDVAGAMPLPARHPWVAFRGGIDLNPLDVRDDDTVRWLRTLVWPEQEERRALLGSAVRIAAADPPRMWRGDLLDLLDAAVQEAAGQGEVVVFHSAVIAYLDQTDRRRFADRMRALVAAGAVRWVSNEGARVLPDVTATARGGRRPEERFVLGLDGRAVAWTHGHGASLTWSGGTGDRETG